VVPSTSSVSDHNDSHTSTGTNYIHCRLIQTRLELDRYIGVSICNDDVDIPSKISVCATFSLRRFYKAALQLQ